MGNKFSKVFDLEKRIININRKSIFKIRQFKMPSSIG